MPVGDADALADRICRLIEDKDMAKRFGEEAAKVYDIANPEAVYEQWREYLEQIV